MADQYNLQIIAYQNKIDAIKIISSASRTINREGHSHRHHHHHQTIIICLSVYYSISHVGIRLIRKYGQLILKTCRYKMIWCVVCTVYTVLQHYNMVDNIVHCTSTQYTTMYLYYNIRATLYITLNTDVSTKTLIWHPGDLLTYSLHNIYSGQYVIAEVSRWVDRSVFTS